MTDVFISYSRKDKAFVQALHKALSASQRETWVDWDNIPKGTQWWREIEIGIENANTFIFVISPDAIASKVCGEEINHALKNGKRLFPIVWRDIEFSQFDGTNPAHQAIKAYNWLFFRENDDFNAAFTDLIRNLDTNIDYVQQHTEFLRETLKWENNQRNDSFLLQGDELVAAEAWLQEAEQRLAAIESDPQRHHKKDPNPLLTEQQRNFILKSRESEDAKQRAAEILQQAKENADRRTKISVTLLAFSLIGAVTAYAYGQNRSEFAQQKVEEASNATQIAYQKSNEAQAAVIRANRSTQNLLAKEKQLALVEIRRQALTQQAQQAQKKLQQADQNLVRAQAQLILAQRQEQQALKAAQSARQDKNLALASLSTANRSLNQAQQAVQSAQHQKIEAEAALVAAKLAKQKVEQEKAEAELKRQATAIEVRAIQSKALFGQDKPLDALLLALKAGDQMQQLQTRAFDLPTKQAAQWQIQVALQQAMAKVREQNRFTSDSHIVLLTPDGKTLISGGWDGTIVIWNLEKNVEPRTLIGHQYAVLSLALTPDGKTLFSGGKDKIIRIWNLATGKVIKTLAGHQDDIESLAITPDGKTLFSGGKDRTIKIWNLATGEAIKTLTGHQGDVYSLAIAPDGKTVVSGSGDKTIKVWDIASGQELKTLKGHQNGVWSIALTPDGKTLISGSSDKTLKIWNLITGEEVQTLTGHQGGVWSVALTTDGKTIVSGSADKTLKV